VEPWTFGSVASSSGSDHDAQDAARFRLAWALAHSRRAGDAARAAALLQPGAHKWGDAVQARDRHYITAMAHFNDGDYLAARVAADEALRIDAGCRQAEALVGMVACRFEGCSLVSPVSRTNDM
jgi:fission 1 protein